MSFFDEVFSKLFKKKSSDTIPVIHEPLERSEKQEVTYQNWVTSGMCGSLIDSISDAHHKKNLGILSEYEVHILNTPYANGIAISYHADIGEEPFRMLFDYFKEQTLTMGYRLAQADRRILDKGEYEETIEKWYLKPAISTEKVEVVDQIYGNVLLEHNTIDRKPSFIKLMVNIYQDRSYTKALEFDEYLQKVFNTQTGND